jgi:hypothetical protein
MAIEKGGGGVRLEQQYGKEEVPAETETETERETETDTDTDQDRERERDKTWKKNCSVTHELGAH